MYIIFRKHGKAGKGASKIAKKPVRIYT